MDLLKKEDCNEILTEKITRTKFSRPELDRLKDKLRSGDTVIVESFSRRVRSPKDLIELVNYYEEKQVKLVSLKENFDTTTPQGSLMMTVFQAFSQFERDLVVERTKEGLESTLARGELGGRPRINAKNKERATGLYNSREYNIKEISDITKVSKPTIC